MFFCYLLSVFTEASLDDLILVPPYVNGKGVSNMLNLYGNYSILSYGGDQHIKLGFMSPSTGGALVYKGQIGQEKWLIDLKVHIEELKKGDEGHGMLIFFTPTDKIELGSFYGIKNVLGFCIALDIKDGMDILVKIYYNNILQKTSTYKFYDEDDVTIKISQGETLKVELDDSYEQLVVYDSNKFFINKQSFIGISASNGISSSGSFNLRSIQPSVLQVVPKEFERGEREGSGKMIWVIFVISCAGLIYYLYDKQLRKKD